MTLIVSALLQAQSEDSTATFSSTDGLGYVLDFLTHCSLHPGLPGSHRAAMLLGRHTSAFKYPQKTSQGVHLSEGARHALHPNLEINRSNWIKMFIVIRAVYRLWWLRPGENKRSQEARISTSPLYSPPHALSFSHYVHCTDIEIWRIFCRTQVTYCMGHLHLI